MNVRELQTVAQALRAREDELVARMLARFAAEVPDSGVASDPEMAAAMRQSSYANLRAAIAHLANGDPPLPAGPPSGAIEEARTSAQTGVPARPSCRPRSGSSESSTS